MKNCRINKICPVGGLWGGDAVTFALLVTLLEWSRAWESDTELIQVKQSGILKSLPSSYAWSAFTTSVVSVLLQTLLWGSNPAPAVSFGKKDELKLWRFDSRPPLLKIWELCIVWRPLKLCWIIAGLKYCQNALLVSGSHLFSFTAQSKTGPGLQTAQSALGL